MKADGHAFWALLKIMDHLHSAACCRLTIRTEEPLLLSSISCLVCERDTTEPVKLMRYGGVVMTDGCEVYRPEEAEPVGAGAGVIDAE